MNEALREAFAWLVGEGLLVPKRDGWYVISRHGRKMAKRADVDAYRDGNPQRPAAVKQLEVETG